MQKAFYISGKVALKAKFQRAKKEMLFLAFLARQREQAFPRHQLS